MELLEQVLERRLASQEEAHPERLMTMSRLADLLLSLGMRDEAIALLDEPTALLPSCPAGNQAPGVDLRLRVADMRRALDQS